MKKIFLTFFTLVLGCFLLISKVHAISTVPSPSESAISPTKSILDLENRIASRAVELHVSERRGIIGTVEEISSTQLTLKDVNGNTRIVHVDELTKFSSPSAKISFGISDINRGMTVGILGLYYKDTRIIIARFVNGLIFPKIVHAVVTGIDKKNFVLSVTTSDKMQLTLDIEDITRIFSYAKDGGLTKTGFSKIKLGESIVAIGFNDPKIKNQIVTSRLIALPELPKNPSIDVSVSQEPSPILSPTPSVLATPTQKPSL